MRSGRDPRSEGVTGRVASAPSLAELRRRTATVTTVGLPAELLIALLVGAGLRLYRLGDESVWYDEAYSIVTVQEYSWWGLLVEHSTIDPHPPLHYLLTRAWIGFMGSSEIAIRLPSVILGVASVPLLYGIGRRLFDRRTAGLAALFFAFSPFQIWHAQDARMYALFVFLALASFYLLVRLMEEYTRRRALGFVIATTLMGYTHLYALFVIFAQVLFLSWRSLRVADPDDSPFTLPIRRWVPSMGAVGVLLSPWLFSLLLRLLTDGSDTTEWIPEPEPDVFVHAFTLLSFGYGRGSWLVDMYPSTAPPTFLLALAAVTVLLATVRIDHADRTEFASLVRGALPVDDRSALGLLASWLLIPLVLPFVLSIVMTPMFLLRPLTVASPAFLLLLARGARTLPSVPVSSVVAVLLVSGMVLPLAGYYAEDNKEQWDDATQYIEHSAAPGDVVIVAPAYSYRAFWYYYDQPLVDAVTMETDASESRIEEAIPDGGDAHVLIYGVWGEERDRFLERVGRAVGADGSDVTAERRYYRIFVYRFEAGGNDAVRHYPANAFDGNESSVMIDVDRLVASGGATDTPAWYGPYDEFDEGTYSVTFLLNASGSGTVGTVDVAIGAADESTEFRVLEETSLEPTDGIREVTLTVTFPHDVTDAEFRGFVTDDEASVTLHSVTVERIENASR